MHLSERSSRFTALLPSLGLAVLSKFTCAACVTAYSGVLASIGVGFVATDSGLTILTAGLLALGLASVAWSTRRHRHLGPLAVVVVGSGVLLTARSGMPSTRVLLAGAALTLAGSVWNLWLERRPTSCCADVATHESTQ
jgi:MerC mercury resistance protein